MSETTIRRPLWIRITAYGFGAVLFASAAIGGAAWYRQNGMNAQSIHKEMMSDIDVINSDMDGQKRTASNVALTIAGQPETADLIENGDMDGLVSRYGGNLPAMIGGGGVQLITFDNANGVVVSRIHDPSKFGDDVRSRRKTVVSALSTGKLVAGTEPGRTAVGMFAAAPVLKDGKVVGVVDVGTLLGDEYFKPLADRIDGEISVNILVDGKLMQQASTLNGKALLTDDQLKAAFDGRPVETQIVDGPRVLAVQAVPFNNFSGEKIGVMSVASDVTSVVQASRSALWTMAILTILVAILTSLAFMLFARSLGSAIARITAIMSRLASDALDAEIEGGGRPDEIGAMARAVQVFKDNAIRAREVERQVGIDRNMTEEERRKIAETERARAEQMSVATSRLAEGLKHLASGNLAFQIDHPLAADFEALRTDFNRAVGQLRETLTSVAQAGASIDSGSREISHSADDLSRRTEQQAASLEETAAALDQITVNVSNSSRRADEARGVAIQANDSARQSGMVVATAVDAMGKIEQSSGQISNIIGVIDDIAFQTNLLALNAGVEAARAGEAGKGFAVVAQEVRELAQRSAKAAKEIKELIRNSSSEVENGVKLVSQTGEALKKIEDYIVAINQHMDAMATSAREQSVGLSEVNTAVNQMDQVTQQNAAMVEETNAASATLANEAGRLRELIAQFQLGADGSAGTAALRQVASRMAAPRSNAAPAASPAPQAPRRAPVKAAAGATASAAGQDWQEF